MRWSWRIGRLFGIGVYLHATFLLLLGYVALLGYRAGGSLLAALPGVAFICMIFGIVVLHELGHALTARRYGIATRDITLLPIGGVARLERMPRDPRQELAVALAGPAVNVALALLLYPLLLFTEGRQALAGTIPLVGDSFGGGLVSQLIHVNLFLALFNLIPAFPMDGGRVLRALLSLRSGSHVRATETAARVGRFFAIVFAVGGLFVWNNPFLVFIAIFVWLGAAGEAAAEQTSATLDGVTLERVMITDVRTLAPHDPLARAVELTLAGFQQDFPVVDGGGTLVGLLTRRELMHGLSERGAGSAVRDAMRTHFEVASPDDAVEAALARLKACDCHAMPVVRGGRLLGVLTTENVSEFIMLRTALRGGSGSFARA